MTLAYIPSLPRPEQTLAGHPVRNAIEEVFELLLTPFLTSQGYNRLDLRYCEDGDATCLVLHQPLVPQISRNDTWNLLRIGAAVSGAGHYDWRVERMCMIIRPSPMTAHEMVENRARLLGHAQSDYARGLITGDLAQIDRQVATMAA